MDSNNINQNSNINMSNSNILNSNNNININNNYSNISTRRFVDQEVGTDDIYNNNNLNVSNFQNKNYESQLLNNSQQNNNQIQSKIINYNESQIASNDKPVEVENFSQQVDFLFHPDNPEYQPSLQTIKNKYKITKRQNSAKPYKQLNERIKKSKSKGKNKKKSQSKKNIIKPDFNLCTKTNPQGLINPDLKKYELKYESRYHQQCRERERKIAEYDKNLLRTKDNFNAKKKLMKNWNQYLNYSNKDDISKNEYESNYSDYSSNKLKNLSKPDIPQHITKKMDFNPVKYDYIINSLLYEITDIKKQRKKENAYFKKKIKQLQVNLNKNDKNENKNKEKPKSSCKLKSNKNDKINKYKNPDKLIRNLVKNYFAPKIKSKSCKNNIEHEIPNNDTNNNFYIEGMDAKIMNDDRMNEFYYGQKMQVLDNLSKIQKENELLNQQLRDKLNEKNDSNHQNNYKIYNYNEYVTNNNNNNYNNKNNFICKSNQNKKSNQISNNNYNNNNQIQFNMINNINIKTLNYQDKMQILAQLNNTMAQYSKGIPKLVNKVNETLDKMYGKIDNPIVKVINNNPLVKISSKSLYHSISTKSDRLIEAIINDLLIDCVFDLKEIEDAQKEKLKKNDLLNEINEAYNNLFLISQNEFNIFKENNLKNNITQNNNKENDNKEKLNNPVLFSKFKALPDIKMVNLCEKYKNTFKDHIMIKGDNGYTKYELYKIYEEFFDKEIKYMLNEELNGYIKHLDDYAKQMYQDEILELNKINK